MILYKPLKYFIIYILITLAINFWGPLVYFDYDRITIAVYMLSFLTLFSVGYILGAGSETVVKCRGGADIQFEKVYPVIKVCSVTALSLIMADFISSAVQGKITLDITQMGKSYVDFYADYYSNEGSAPVQATLLMLTGFPKFVAMVLGVYYFGKLNGFYKFSVLAIFILTIVTKTISGGNQKSLGDILIFLLSVLSVKMLDYSKLRKIKLMTGMISITLLFVIIISFSLYQRLDFREISVFDAEQFSLDHCFYDFDHVIFRIFGYKFGFGLALLISGYLAGGYYGLYLSMKLPFMWTFGAGSSYSVMKYSHKYFNLPDIFERTYLYRMEETFGWKGLVKWNTIFPWLASDFTFIGALFVFMLAAYIYGVAWKEILLYRNPLSLLMFSMINIGLVFIIANNQLLHGIDGFTLTAIMTVYWLIKHKEYNTELTRAAE